MSRKFTSLMLAIAASVLIAIPVSAGKPEKADWCSVRPDHPKCQTSSPTPEPPTPSPEPSQSTPPSPSPEPSQSTSPSPAPVDETWDLVFINYRAVDAYCNGKHVKSATETPEWDSAIRAQQQAVANIKAWNPGLRFTATWVERPLLTSVSYLGDADGSCWPGPGDVPPAGDFDSTFVAVEPTNDLDTDGSLPFWYKWGGLSLTCGTCYYSGGYSTGIQRYSDDWQMRMTVHEWLHPTTAWFREQGAFVPDPHEMDAYGWTVDIDWYRDTIAGNLPDRNGDGHGDGITDWHIATAGTPVD